MHFIPQNANLEGEQRELKGYTAPLLQGKRQHKISYLFLTVYPFISTRRLNVGRIVGVQITLRLLQISNGLFTSVCTPYLLPFQVLSASSSCRYQPTSSRFKHILKGLSPNLFARFILKVLGFLFTYFRLLPHLNRRQTASAWVSLVLKGWSALSQIKYSCWPSKYFSEKS